MIVVYPDTNALHNNVALSNDSGRKLADELARADGQLRLSPVVVAEMKRRELGEADAAAVQMSTVVARALRGSTVDGSPIEATLKQTIKDLRRSIHAKYEAVLARPYVHLDDWPEISTQELTERELERRRPFLEVAGTGTVGHRDAVIWEGVLESARWLEDGDTLIFVSKDHAFWDDKQEKMHPDLVDDLNGDAEIWDSQVRMVKDIYRARILIRELRDELTARQARVESAMVELVTSFQGDSIGWHYDPRIGDEVRDAFPLVEAPRDLEDSSVVAVDLRGDVTISSHNGREYTARQDAAFTIEGNLRLDSWLLDEDPSVEIWGDINEYYVSAAVTRDVTVEAHIDYGDDDSRPEIGDFEVYMAAGTSDESVERSQPRPRD